MSEITKKTDFASITVHLGTGDVPWHIINMYSVSVYSMNRLLIYIQTGVIWTR